MKLSEIKNFGIKDIKSLFVPKDVNYPTKTTINLAEIEKKKKSPQATRLKIIAGVILAAAVLKFGGYDQYKRLAEARKNYNKLHQQNIEMQTQLKEYGKVLNEYRAYSTDWMQSTAEDNEPVVGVDRKEVLDMVKKEFIKNGEVDSITINSLFEKSSGKDKTKKESKDVLIVKMRAASLKATSSILSSVRKNKLTKQAEIVSAESRNDGSVDFSMSILLKKDDEKKK